MIGSNIQRPGTYYRFTFTSARGGFRPLPQQIAVVGVQTGTTATAGEVYKVISPEQGDADFGAGSELALMLRAVFALGSARGKLPHVYAVPLDAPSELADQPAITTLTITGTAQTAGDLIVRIAGRTVRTGVLPTFTPNEIATALHTAIVAQDAELPVTADATDNVVTGTHRTNGVNGNDVVYEFVRAPAGLTVTIEQTQTGIGVADITGALDATLATDFNAIAIANHTAADVDIARDHLDEAWDAGSKRWRHVFLGDTGSLGSAQSLASADDFRFTVVAMRNSPSLPSEIAAATAALTFSEEKPNFNYDGAELPIFPCKASDAWTGAEIEALLAAGVTPLSRARRNDRVKVEKLVTTQVTQDDVDFLPLRDITTPLVSEFVARQLDATYAQRKPQNIDALSKLIVNVLLRVESAGFIRNVQSQIGDILVVEDEQVTTRAIATVPFIIVPPLHQVVFDLRAAA